MSKPPTHTRVLFSVVFNTCLFLLKILVCRVFDDRTIPENTRKYNLPVNLNFFVEIEIQIYRRFSRILKSYNIYISIFSKIKGPKNYSNLPVVWTIFCNQGKIFFFWFGLMSELCRFQKI